MLPRLTFERRAFPAPPPNGSYNWKEQREFVEALMTAIARRTLALDTDALPANAAHVVEVAYANAFMTFGYGAGGSKQDAEHWKGVCALLGAALGDAEVVARCTGGKTLGAKIQKSKRFDLPHDLRGFARHLATAARARVPASHVDAAMAPLRAQLAANTLPDPRIALIAAHAVFAHVAGLAGSELADACRAWLDGGALGDEAPAPPPMVADGDDPRARIFEQFSAVLANDKTAAACRDELGPDNDYGFHFRVFGADRASDAATFLFLARQPLPADWEARIDPHVARWLGGTFDPTRLASRRNAIISANNRYRHPKQVRAYVIRKMAFDPAVRALFLGDRKTLVAYTGGGKLAPYQPGKLFKDDWRKLLRYLGAAVAAKSPPKSKAKSTPTPTRADVEPAWFDFLARPQTERVPWSYLLAIQAVITVDIGGGAHADVGRDLQRVITGA